MRQEKWVSLTTCGLVLVTATVLASCETQDKPMAKPVNETALQGAATEGWIRIVRGVNGTFCDASAIGNGNDPNVGPKEDLTNLSVSCSKNKTDTVKDLRQFLPNAHACYSTLKDLRNARKDVTVVRDPETGNPFHCLLGTITPNQFISRSRFE